MLGVVEIGSNKYFSNAGVAVLEVFIRFGEI